MTPSQSLGQSGRWRAALPLCLLALLAACGSAPPAPSARQSGGSESGAEPQRAAARLTPQQASDVTIYAIGLVGTPYRYGGNTPATGFDCSGLIGHVYQKTAAVLAPRTVSRLQGWGQSVPAHELRSGDLVVFSGGGVVNHAGIYVGDGRFVHAPSSGGTVRLDSLRAKHWASQPTAFRRP